MPPTVSRETSTCCDRRWSGFKVTAFALDARLFWRWRSEVFYPAQRFVKNNRRGVAEVVTSRFGSPHGNSHRVFRIRVYQFSRKPPCFAAEDQIVFPLIRDLCVELSSLSTDIVEPS